MEAVSSVGGRRALEVVVCLGDSVVDVIHLRTPGVIIAGSAPGCRVSLAPERLGGATRVTLAALDASGQAWVSRRFESGAALAGPPGVPPDGVGEGYVGTDGVGPGGALDDEPLVALGDDEKLSFIDGDLRLLVRWVPDVTTAPRGTLVGDTRWLGFVAATAAAHALFMALLFAIPPEAKALAWLDNYLERRAVIIKEKPLEDPLQKPPEVSAATGDDSAGGESAAPAIGATGRQGRPETTTRGKTAIRGQRPEDRPGPGNPEALRDWVSRQGPLSVLKQANWSPVTGTSEEWGSRDRYAYGADFDGPDGDGPGSFGSGFEGTGPGGCPPGATHCIAGTIGVDGRGPGGRIGTGFCRDNPERCGVGSGGEGRHPGLGPRGARGPIVDIKPPIVEDGLDKAIIKRIVRGKHEAIRYCYEKQLTVAPGIAGTLGVSFVIGPNGNVISANAEGSAGAAAVDGCVLDLVRGLQFPKSSSLTRVKYPFTFRAAGQ